MTGNDTHQNATGGIIFILIAATAITVNDMLLKLLSGGYPLHQMVFTRSTIGIAFSLILVQLEGGWGILRTKTPGLHLLRCVLIIISNMTFFAALAALPLAEATAVFFISPLLITLLGVPLLGEKVGPLRIAAVLVGFVGVLIVVAPWESAENREVSFLIYLLPMIAALTYALNQLLTRKLGSASKASALAVYIQLGFIAVSSLFWMIAGDGRYAPSPDNVSLYFLLRAWAWPEGRDFWLFVLLGLNSAVVGYTISQAYRLGSAATVAPFEYIGLPLSVFWGWIIWSDLPGGLEFAGIALIIGSGLFVFLRERQKRHFLISKNYARRRY